MLTEKTCLWLEIIIYERFGHEFQISSTQENTILSIKGSDALIIFDRLEKNFNKSAINLLCSYWDAQMEGWWSALSLPLPAPSTEKLPTPLIEWQDKNSVVHYDILGLTYWMLTRQEEIGRKDLDKHGRFPAISSHAYNHGYLERPIVDEWLYILGQIVQKVWPQLKLKQHQFAIKISHDVDNPSRYGFCKPQEFMRVMGGDIIKRFDLKSALYAPWIYLNTRKTLHPKDPYNTFDWIMDESEKHGLTSAFYFICGGNSHRDADYEPEHPTIRALMRRIYDRGHEIGLHPSYNTYQTPTAIAVEAQRLKQICYKENIEQKQWGGRMHFLRWEQPTTLHGLEQSNMNYDSSLGYADHVGFRCGTCFEYPAFDPVRKKVLKLRIRPLIAMESSIIDKRYMGLGYGKEALEKFLNLKRNCQMVKGNFTLLWHNSHFLSKKDKILYKNIISSSARTN